MQSLEPLSVAQAETLLTVARESIAAGLETGKPLVVRLSDYSQALREVRASFVTLNREGRLRGCIGSLEARLALVEDVAEHAFAAAFRDPRFAPVAESELPTLEIHISILTPNEALRFEDEADLLRQLRPGTDGLIIARGERRATFLPSVWESLPEPAEFLAHLKLKAGISPGDAGEPLQAWRYTAESIPREPYQ